MYWEEAGRVTGPVLPQAPLDEMTEQELRNVLTYQRIAIRTAWDDGAADEVVDVMVHEYDLTFEHLASVSDEFRDAVEKGRHRVLGGFTRENIDKYRKLANLEVITVETKKTIQNGVSTEVSVKHSAN